MEAIPGIISGWLPLVAAITAIFGWTYKLNRDLKADLQKEMMKNKDEIMGRFNSHMHESGTGDVLMRAIANK